MSVMRHARWGAGGFMAWALPITAERGTARSKAAGRLSLGEPPASAIARRARPSPGARHSASLLLRVLPPCCLARAKAWNARPPRLDRLRAAIDRTAAQKHAMPVSTFPHDPSNHRSFSQVQQPRLLPGAASRRGRAFSSPPRGMTSSAHRPSGYPRSIFSQANGGRRRARWGIGAPLGPDLTAASTVLGRRRLRGPVSSVGLRGAGGCHLPIGLAAIGPSDAFHWDGRRPHWIKLVGSGSSRFDRGVLGGGRFWKGFGRPDARGS